MSDATLLGPDPAFARAIATARRAPVTLLFLAACIALFFAAERQGSTTDVDILVRFGALERGRVWSGDLWRLVSAGFLHIGLLHLVWNVATIFGWSAPVERELGSSRFAALYLGAVVGASATSLAVHDVVSAGASGAGFGLVASWLVLDARRLGSWRAFAADRRVRRTVLNAVLWTAVLSGMRVDHAAHAGGFVAGMALTWALTQPASARRGARSWTWSAASLAIALPAALALVARPGLTAYEKYAIDRDIRWALSHQDLDQAERLLRRADEARYASLAVEGGRAFVLERRGDFDGAARVLETLQRSPDAATRSWAATSSKVLVARRLTEGRGMAPDPRRARKLLEEVCAAGEVATCRWLEDHPAAAR